MDDPKGPWVALVGRHHHVCPVAKVDSEERGAVLTEVDLDLGVELVLNEEGDAPERGRYGFAGREGDDLALASTPNSICHMNGS